MDTGTNRFGYSWAAYKSIEEDMIRVAEYIPLETLQYEVYSFKLADIILRSCSHIESLFKDIIRNQPLSDHPDQNLIESKKKKKRLTIKDYIEVFAEYLGLTPLEITVRRNNESMRPFKEFENSRLDDKIPIWWNAYNSLKHDFYRNIKEKGTLGNALDSLSALFALNCRSAWKLKLSENLRYLVENRVVSSPNFIHPSDLLNHMKEDNRFEKYNLLAQTGLFESRLSYNQETIGKIIIGEGEVVTNHPTF